ncbi:E3 ubiquitin-protein ligase MARCHF4-like [Littorina saxatilis]|uniref:RING-CH-type domain-containing protein n=1 Tax=Littorina saxatilis TaxID=31220 RepID=A0AAN9C1W2_9CAEN
MSKQQLGDLLRQGMYKECKLLPRTQQTICEENIETHGSLFYKERQGDSEEDLTISPRLQRAPSFLVALSHHATVHFTANGHVSPLPSGQPPRRISSPAAVRCSPGSLNIHCETKRQQNLLSPPDAKEQPGRQERSSIFSITSDEPACRICHDGDNIEELVSPCYCSGSVGLLHLSCLEHWLGTSQTTRCEICQYEFTLKRLPRPVTEFFQDPPSPRQRNYLICDFVCLLILTPVTLTSAYLCAEGSGRYPRVTDGWQAQGLFVLAFFVIFIYVAWLLVAVHHHFTICKRWRTKNQVVKITFISPIRSKRTLRSPSIPSCKFDSPNSPLIATRGSLSIRRSITESGGRRHTSLVSRPFLRPILKYSSQLLARSWQSGLTECAVDLGCSPCDSANDSSKASLVARCQNVHHIRHETYV